MAVSRWTSQPTVAPLSLSLSSSLVGEESFFYRLWTWIPCQSRITFGGGTTIAAPWSAFSSRAYLVAFCSLPVVYSPCDWHNNNLIIALSTAISCYYILWEWSNRHWTQRRRRRVWKMLEPVRLQTNNLLFVQRVLRFLHRNLTLSVV